MKKQEYVTKISEKLKNRIVSEETKEKLSEKSRLQWEKTKGE